MPAILFAYVWRLTVAGALAVPPVLACLASPPKAGPDPVLPPPEAPAPIEAVPAPAPIEEIAAPPEDGAPAQAPEAAPAQPAAWVHPLPQMRYCSRHFTDDFSHLGIDLCAQEGTQIFSASAGTVLESDYDAPRGYYIIIEHGGGLYTEYEHLSRLDVEAGQAVEAGAQIGLVGSTGFSTGNHLHFAVRQDDCYLDPEDFYAEQASVSLVPRRQTAG